MNRRQKLIKLCAITLAILLISLIIKGIYNIVNILDNDKDITLKEITINETINNILVNIDAGKLIIKNGESLKLEYTSKSFKYSINDSILEINYKNNSFINNNKDKVVIYIPSSINDLNIEVGAGVVDISNIYVNNLNIELGVGKLDIDNVTINNDSIVETGIGKVNILNSYIQDIELGIGEINYNLNTVDYRLNLSKGIGSIKLDNVNALENVIGNGNNNISINLGIGSINIFSKGVV